MRRILVATLALFLAATFAGCGALSRSNPARSASAATYIARAPGPNGDGIYLASFPVLELQSVSPTALAAIGFHVTAIPQGMTEAIGVVNIWYGVAGERSEETRLVNYDGQIVASDTNQLNGTSPTPLSPADLSQFAVDVLTISHLPPGAYQIVVLLDGREYARYTVRITAPPGSGGGLRQGQ